MRSLAALLLVVGSTGPAAAQEVDGSLRGGVYADDDHTTVIRSLASAVAKWSKLSLSVHEEVDVVTSASVDVRSSPFLDAVSGASARSPKMNDTRSETSVAAGWEDGPRKAGASLVFAAEGDYTSVGGGFQGSIDVNDRLTTLLGGVTATTNHVYRAHDRAFRRDMGQVGWSFGVAQVLGESDALRLRYDGILLGGYQASPYRAVRFGDWKTSLRPGEMVWQFTDTIGPAAGLPENVPSLRIRHALVAEHVHAFSTEWGVWGQVRVAHDSWGIDALTLGAELRFARGRFLGRAGYRFYTQSAAEFFLDKYTQAPTAYDFWTSDKELGEERGHTGSLDVAYWVHEPAEKAWRARLDARVEVLRYEYPGFILLDRRTSVFTEVGLRLEY